MLRPSFVPPAEIRELRDYTRLRVDLVAERTRHAQRLEKLLEDALVKLSLVATDILGVSGREMIEALIAGERDPQILAEMARGGCVSSTASSSRRLPDVSTITTLSSPGFSSTRSTVSPRRPTNSPAGSTSSSRGSRVVLLAGRRRLGDGYFAR